VLQIVMMNRCSCRTQEKVSEVLRAHWITSSFKLQSEGYGHTSPGHSYPAGGIG
jgi:hypothetical protein